MNEEYDEIENDAESAKKEEGLEDLENWELDGKELNRLINKNGQL